MFKSCFGSNKRLLTAANRKYSTSQTTLFSFSALKLNEKQADFETGDQVPQLSFENVKYLIHGVNNKASPIKSYTLVDVRTKAEFDEGRIPTSVNIPLATVENAFRLDGERFKETYGIVKPHENQHVIFYCLSGKRSSEAIRLVSKLGLGLRLVNYPGSWKEYSENTFP